MFSKKNSAIGSLALALILNAAEAFAEHYPSPDSYYYPTRNDYYDSRYYRYNPSSNVYSGYNPSSNVYRGYSGTRYVTPRRYNDGRYQRGYYQDTGQRYDSQGVDRGYYPDSNQRYDDRSSYRGDDNQDRGQNRDRRGYSYSQGVDRALEYEHRDMQKERDDRNGDFGSEKSPSRLHRDSYTSDRDIERKIGDKIHSGWFSKGYNQVKIEVRNGNVTLSGNLNTFDYKEEIEKEVRKIAGVRNINNEIEIIELGPQEPSTDE